MSDRYLCMKTFPTKHLLAPFTRKIDYLDIEFSRRVFFSATIRDKFQPRRGNCIVNKFKDDSLKLHSVNFWFTKLVFSLCNLCINWCDFLVVLNFHLSFLNLPVSHSVLCSLYYFNIECLTYVCFLFIIYFYLLLKYLFI